MSHICSFFRVRFTRSSKGTWSLTYRVIIITLFSFCILQMFTWANSEWSYYIKEKGTDQKSTVFSILSWILTNCKPNIMSVIGLRTTVLKFCIQGCCHLGFDGARSDHIWMGGISWLKVRSRVMFSYAYIHGILLQPVELLPAGHYKECRYKVRYKIRSYVIQSMGMTLAGLHAQNDWEVDGEQVLSTNFNHLDSACSHANTCCYQ